MEGNENYQGQNRKLEMMEGKSTCMQGKETVGWRLGKTSPIGLASSTLPNLFSIVIKVVEPVLVPDFT